MRKVFIYTSLMFALLLGISSCNNKIDYGTDPYGGSQNILDIRFADQPPYPSQGRPGDELTYRVTGLGDHSSIVFYINNVQAEISSRTDSTISVILPSNVSTGGAKLVVNGQIFAGPITPIIGRVSMDPTFNPGTGSNGTISTIVRLSNGQYFIGGSFTDYNGNSSLTDINGIARISSTGEFVTGMQFGLAAEGGGSITNIVELPGDRLLISGAFNVFDEDRNVRNITVLNTTGSLYRESVPILNLTDDPENSTMIVPVFNGGIDLGVRRSFVHNNKVTVIGNFRNYTSNYYPRSTYNDVLRDFFPFANVLRMNMDGSLDSTFLVNHNALPKRGTFGVNGTIADGYMDEEGRLIMVGSFTRFDNRVSTNRILRLNADGSLDESFNVGTGANNGISQIVPTAGGKFFVLGAFTSFNGQSANGITLLHADGTVDAGFSSRVFEGGIPSYMTELSNGLLVVTGSFVRYDNVIREGLMVLNPDGSLAEGYNNTGKLVGMVSDSYEGVNSIGQRTLTLVGYISSFNGNPNLGNIVRIVIQD